MFVCHFILQQPKDMYVKKLYILKIHNKKYTGIKKIESENREYKREREREKVSDLECINKFG